MRKILVIDDQKDQLSAIEAMIKSSYPTSHVIISMAEEEGIGKQNKTIFNGISSTNN